MKFAGDDVSLDFDNTFPPSMIARALIGWGFVVFLLVRLED
jgi:hypothetical protein